MEVKKLQATMRLGVLAEESPQNTLVREEAREFSEPGYNLYIPLFTEQKIWSNWCGNKTKISLFINMFGVSKMAVGGKIKTLFPHLLGLGALFWEILVFRDTRKLITYHSKS